MRFQIIKSEKFITNKWAGGTTTQLYIFPNTSNYQERDFAFRLSTAKVELEESNFTPLPDVSRKLMVLDGKIEIRHKGHHNKILNKFDIDTFEGDWETSSKGKCIDFNLMSMGDNQGHLYSVILDEDKSHKYSIQSKCKQLFIYCYKGKVIINLNTKDKVLDKGDLLAVKGINTSSLPILSKEKSTLIFVEIY